MSPLTCQWQKGSTPIPGATSASYTTLPATAADNGAQYSVTISNSVGSATSAVATLTVNAATDVLTYHNDNARTGQNLTESILTTDNVNSTQFGKVGLLVMNGSVDAEPLYASNVAIPGNGTHNLLIGATQNDAVYAFDPDSGALIWRASMLKTGESTSKNPTCKCGQVGVTSTPVIDRTSGANGAIYVVASTTDASGNYHQRLHALDLVLGTELFGGPVEIQATYPGTGDNSDGTNVIFDPEQYRQRTGLLMVNGVIYTGWASFADTRPYTGWIIGYSESTLAQVNVLNITPNGAEGAIWMSGAGPAADSSGNIYFLDANGAFDETLNSSGFPVNGDYGNAFLKLSTSGNQLAVADFFEMSDQSAENTGDIDLGSGGAMLLPDLTSSAGNVAHLAVGAGKDSNLYVVNRDSMGKLSDNDSNVYQKLIGVLPGGVFAAPVYFNNNVYYGAVGSPIQAFTIADAKLLTSSTMHTVNSFTYPGTTPSASANGTKNGIIWAIEASTTAVLHAYDASSLNELYNSSQASDGRDLFGMCSRFITPTIANGKVFVGTPNGVVVFGLLP